MTSVCEAWLTRLPEREGFPPNVWHAPLGLGIVGVLACKPPRHHTTGEALASAQWKAQDLHVGPCGLPISSAWGIRLEVLSCGSSKCPPAPRARALGFSPVTDFSSLTSCRSGTLSTPRPAIIHIRLDMKRTYALLALGSLLSGVEARLLRWADSKREADWRPAQATIAVDQLLHGVSPKPTNAPRAPDAAPGPGLDRRASSDNTCGYVSGITGTLLVFFFSFSLPFPVLNRRSQHLLT